MPRKKTNRRFGTLEYRPNKKHPTRVVASYPTPEDAFDRWPGLPARQSKSFPIEQEDDAVAWLGAARKRIDAGVWEPPEASERKEKAKRITFDQYFPTWLDQRRYKGRPLKAGTRYRLAKDYENHISPVLGATPLIRMTQSMAERFRDGLPDQPSMRANVMKLLRAMLRTASQSGVDGEEPLIPKYPLGAGEPRPRREHVVTPCTPEEMKAIHDAMPMPYALAVYIGCCIEMRIGEVCALQRRDINHHTGMLHIGRTRVTMDSQRLTDRPKTDGSDREEPIPAQLMPLIDRHLETYVGEDPESWLFPSVRDHDKPLHPNSLRSWYSTARKKAKRPDLRFHDLRHTGLTWLAEEGATTRELMDAGGHTSPQIAMVYQHSVDGRRRMLADRVGERIIIDDDPDMLRRRIIDLDKQLKVIKGQRDELKRRLQTLEEKGDE
ncbi:hypothetical protein CS006_08015 [Bifidobacterium primatium]|uniref:Tyr recombinase domain-containing protein n=2 Tax=Bifidobacterium TaxID=1678 RepID=A0A2M9H8K6_9BIFI|nr:MULTISPECIES: site-specific integrase [Bifidobacterium]NEG96026.1 tyrosine-type recombinase/integrase [Bifidobacterium sp. SMB2]NEH10896.1 tyrosine-type recombinase/integrase [Bifidobacterium saimiriisciurei]PJM73154.1 hypothetical protein CS006_08015 [Bifidobacterium primatium]